MNIMQIVMDIETKAQDVINSIDELQKANRLSIERETARLKTAAEQDAERTGERLAEAQRAELELFKQATEEESKAKTLKLEETFARNRSKWINEIVNNITA